MGFRFRKRFKIAPGLHINVSKSGASFSVGGRGLTVNSRGKATLSLPGTGLSQTYELRGKAETRTTGIDTSEPVSKQASEPGMNRIGYSFLLGCVGIFLPTISLAAVPLLISGYEAVINNAISKGDAQRPDSTKGLGLLATGIALGVAGIFLPVFTFASVVTIAYAYEGRKREMGIRQ